MLPAFAIKTVSFKRAVLAALTALSIAAIPAAPALAWGQREQDTLKGAVGALVIENVIRNSQYRNQQQGHYQPRHQQRYYQPRYEPRYEPRHEPRRRHHYQPAPQVSIYSTPAAYAFNRYSSSERRLIQRRLAAYGYYRGGVDGSFGPGTYSAVVAYARSQGQTRELASTNTAFSVYDGLIY